MSKLHIPGDPNSSPFDPAMGDIVIYRNWLQGKLRESFPAIIVKAHSDDMCDLTVFSATGVRYVMRVKFSSDDQTEHTWGWMPEKTPRGIDNNAGKANTVEKQDG